MFSLSELPPDIRDFIEHSPDVFAEDDFGSITHRFGFWTVGQVVATIVSDPPWDLDYKTRTLPMATATDAWFRMAGVADGEVVIIDNEE